MKIVPPVKKVIMFAPYGEDRAPGAKKDTFQDKIYINIAYDLSGSGGTRVGENAGIKPA